MTLIKARYKKIVKLLSLSRISIKEFGLRYFINAAINELKKHKLGVFAPDPTPIKQTYSETQTYKIWLRKNWISPEKKLMLKQELQQYTIKPKIAVMISVSENDKKYLKDTISSIKEQIYENWEVQVFLSGIKENNFENIFDSKIHPHPDSIDSLHEVPILLGAEFVTFIKCGSVIKEDAFLRSIQVLNNNSDTDLIYFDRDEITKNNEKSNPFFKPDWSPDLFLTFDYISDFYLVKTQLFDKLEGFKSQFGSAIHFEFLLRLTEITKKITHIPAIGISIKTPDTLSRSHFFKDSGKVISGTIKRRGIKAEIVNGIQPETWRIKYHLDNQPKVSILIPTKDQKDLLKRCIKSIEQNTDYKNYEIIIVDNQSVKEETISYLNSLPYTVLKYNSQFNFSTINNIASSHASGDFLLFLNDDAAPLESNWLTEMVSICMQDDIGIVGAKLVLSNNTIQHAGLVLLKTGAGFHPLQGIDANSSGYHDLLNMVRNYSAVTGACLLIRKDVFDKIGGYDEEFDLYYGDVDLCLKALHEGYRIVYTPYAKLLHQGSSSIKEQTRSFFAVENHYHFIKKWPYLKNGDPFYNPNLTWDYKINIQ